MKNITRVASPDYVPSIGNVVILTVYRAYIHLFPPDDILHARIQTMGVAEHIFDVNIHGKSVTWHLFDVGGARGQRHSWVPYFDDANAIIFVAPVSAFDQASLFPFPWRQRRPPLLSLPVETWQPPACFSVSYCDSFFECLFFGHVVGNHANKCV